MPTNRRALRREERHQITQEVVTAWLDGDPGLLGELLGLPCSSFPFAIPPDWEDVYPDGSAGSLWHPHGQELWNELDAARKAYGIKRQPPADW